MTIIDYRPQQDEIIEAVDDGIRQLQETGAEARFILVGTVSYERLRQTMAARLRRKPGTLEQYNGLPVVLDPFRTDTVCVLPSPGECAKGVHTYRMED